MAKSKRGTALFDLIGAGRPEAAESLKTPEWWSSTETERASRVQEETANRRPKDAPSPLPKSVIESSQATELEDSVESSGDKKIFELEGDRITISLSSVSAAVVVFGALVIVLGAYEMGRRNTSQDAFAIGYEEGRSHYSAQASSEIEQARLQEPATHLISGLLDDPSRPGDAGGENLSEGISHWVRGYTYVVVQEFVSGRTDDARIAQAFLAKYGVPAEVVQFPSGAIQLISRQGYNRSDPTQRVLAQTLRDRIHEIGAAYFKSGGRYKLEGYFKTLKGDSW